MALGTSWRVEAVGRHNYVRPVGGLTLPFLSDLAVEEGALRGIHTLQAFYIGSAPTIGEQCLVSAKISIELGRAPISMHRLREVEGANLHHFEVTTHRPQTEHDAAAGDLCGYFFMANALTASPQTSTLLSYSVLAITGREPHA